LIPILTGCWKSFLSLREVNLFNRQLSDYYYREERLTIDWKDQNLNP